MAPERQLGGDGLYPSGRAQHEALQVPDERFVRRCFRRTELDRAPVSSALGDSLDPTGSRHSSGTRILFLINSLIGASVLSLVLSYLVQVYSALRERNALALTIDLMTNGTGDAAEALARLMPGGDDSDAAAELGNLVRSLTATKEAHHFYPLLFYFRFKEPLYSVSRFGFILLDLVSLIETGLDRKRFRSLLGSAPVASLRRGTMLLLETLDRHFPTGGSRSGRAEDAWRYRQSYAAAARTLADAGIEAEPDGVEQYVAVRSEWEPMIRRVAPTLGYSISDIARRNAERPL